MKSAVRPANVCCSRNTPYRALRVTKRVGPGSGKRGRRGERGSSNEDDLTSGRGANRVSMKTRERRTRACGGLQARQGLRERRTSSLCA